MFQLHRSATRDLTWIGHEMLVWSLVEMHFAIICASAPALKAFFTVFFSEPYSKGSKNSETESNAQYGNQSTTTEKGTVHQLDSGDWSDLGKPEKERTKAKMKMKADWATITVTETFSVRRSLSPSQKRMLGID